MNKKLYILSLMFAVSLCGWIKSAQAVEIPNYIKKVEKVKDNVDLIIENLTSKAQGSEQSQQDAEYFNGILREHAAALYAEALTTRTNILKAEQEKAEKKAAAAVAGSLTGGSDNKKQILTDDILPQMQSIAERWNKIVSLEAGIASLEGNTIIIRLPKSNSTLNTSDSQEEKQ